MQYYDPVLSRWSSAQGVADHVGNPATLLTSAQLRRALHAAAEKVVRAMKLKSKELISP